MTDFKLYDKNGKRIEKIKIMKTESKIAVLSNLSGAYYTAKYEKFMFLKLELIYCSVEEKDGKYMLEIGNGIIDFSVPIDVSISTENNLPQ